MDGLALLDQARAAGLTVTAEGDRLRIRGPRQAETIVRLLAAHKGALLFLLTGSSRVASLSAERRELWEERAAIQEHDGGLSREHAEASALAEVENQMKQGANL